MERKTEGEYVPITAIFWDVGGVLLTNAWDHNERREAVAKFGLEAKDFEERHESVVFALERGKLSLPEYLDATVFYKDRPFTRDTFREFMLSRSQPHPEALEFAKNLATSGQCLLATINNESRELNAFRIRQFGLREIFDLFVSSCFAGLRKPDPQIYQLAMDLVQRPPDECCFIDDRAENLEPARQLGMHCIRMQGVQNLRDELKKIGVNAG